MAGGEGLTDEYVGPEPPSTVSQTQLDLTTPSPTLQT